eukprot:gnl/MRDRNA2_/MRDRNA2_123603_c0_seq1.p1 gnl/MRDRNA2_/MRDRNA2_123603_c0~~gnl/MRDRNA2_/MRDRNA2_123603_c0_seq1.p1  ORF type:complete len:180 (+),score=26.70 gnl/MRDRNA2_/MRDRNA2_123603_c0_seq1:103-642(+)
MALAGMLGYGPDLRDICKKKAAMAHPQKENKWADEGADSAESMANTTAPPTPLSAPTSSPPLMPLSRSVSDESSCQLQPLIGDSAVPTFPAGPGSGHMCRFHDRHGVMRYTLAGYAADSLAGYYVADSASQEHSCHDTSGVGEGTCLDGALRIGGTCLDGALRIPCRRYGRDGRMVCRY